MACWGSAPLDSARPTLTTDTDAQRTFDVSRGVAPLPAGSFGQLGVRATEPPAGRTMSGSLDAEKLQDKIFGGRGHAAGDLRGPRTSRCLSSSYEPPGSGLSVHVRSLVTFRDRLQPIRQRVGSGGRGFKGLIHTSFLFEISH